MSQKELFYSLREEERAKNEVKLAIDAFHSAMINADEKSLNKLLHIALSYGHSSGNIETKEGLINSILNKNSNFKSIKSSDEIIKIVQETAIVRHVFFAHTNDKNIPGTIKLNILLVWKKQNDQWKLLARQAIRS